MTLHINGRVVTSIDGLPPERAAELFAEWVLLLGGVW